MEAKFIIVYYLNLKNIKEKFLFRKTYLYNILLLIVFSKKRKKLLKILNKVKENPSIMQQSSDARIKYCLLPIQKDKL